MRTSGRIHVPSSLHRALLAASLVIASVTAWNVAPTSAATVPFRIDLKVLLLDDNSPWVNAIQSQMDVEGVPYKSVPLDSASRQEINAAFLASGDRAFYQAVVGPDHVLALLSDDERAALRTFEAQFGIREVDGYNWANPAVGLNYAAVIGDINGTTANVTAAGLAGGFGYLNGPVPFSAGSYSYLAEPLAQASQLAGASYTTLVGASLPNGSIGSLVGVYSNAGVERMVITAALSSSLPQFKMLAHGIISWVTRGVHFGYNRNNFTFHVDDAFSSDALWNIEFNCTPGEDCPRLEDGASTVPETSAQMTADDVAYAAAWESANDYQLTLAFNGFYANTAEPLTQAFQANASAFRWLNHGAEHLYQGCEQDFSQVPWRCSLDESGQVVWMSQATIFNEIHDSIVTAQRLGLPFDTTEYLSGEHSGLFLNPQQSVDNPNFISALTQAGILFIGSDASRDSGSRRVGVATTIPRHPTALYYNTSTQAATVDEYNWLYTSRASGGSGYCDDNPTTATCIAPLDPATGFTSYIVPTDAAFDLSFILSNDPRPFYAHTSNMTDDRLLYPLLESILGTYRAAFSPATPLANLTLTQAATALDLQTKWATSGISAVTGYVQNGRITVTNTTGVAVPLTAPTGTTVTGATLASYGGEVSGWIEPGSTTGALPAPILVPPVTVPTTTTPPPSTTVPPVIVDSSPPDPTTVDIDHVALTPARLADTRADGVTIDGLFARAGIRGGGSTFEVTVARRGGVAADAAAVSLNVTVVDPAGDGFVTVYPCGAARPTASNVNFQAGVIVPNAVISKVGLDGKVCVFVSDDTQLVVDVNGYFPATSSLHSINPARVLDTRDGYATIDGSQQGEGMRTAGSSTRVQIATRVTVPSDATAVVLNVTVTQSERPGFVTVYPCGSAVPTASNVNFRGGSTVANLVISKIATDGTVCIFTSAATHLVADLSGYFPATTSYKALDPARLLDTRPGFTTIDGQFIGADTRAAGTITELTVVGRGEVPVGAATVMLNVTVTEATGSGFLTVYPCGIDPPLASNLNYVVNTTAAVAALAKVGTDGKVCLFNSGSTQLVADVNGYLLS